MHQHIFVSFCLQKVIHSLHGHRCGRWVSDQKAALCMYMLCAGLHYPISFFNCTRRSELRFASSVAQCSARTRARRLDWAARSAAGLRSTTATGSRTAAERDTTGRREALHAPVSSAARSTARRRPAPVSCCRHPWAQLLICSYFVWSIRQCHFPIAIGYLTEAVCSD